MIASKRKAWIRLIVWAILFCSWIYFFIPCYLDSDWGWNHRFIKENSIQTDALFYSESEAALEAIETMIKKIEDKNP